MMAAASMLATMMGGGAAAGAAGAAGAIGSGSGILSILQGGATLLSIVNGLDGDKQQAEALQAEALDAEEEQVQENLRGIERRTSLKKEARDIVGEQAVAYAAGGQDLTFGTPVNARSEVYRDLDTALESDNMTRVSRISRLGERAAEKRKQAKQVIRGGKMRAMSQGLQFAGSLYGRG